MPQKMSPELTSAPQWVQSRRDRCIPSPSTLSQQSQIDASTITYPGLRRIIPRVCLLPRLVVATLFAIPDLELSQILLASSGELAVHVVRVIEENGGAHDRGVEVG
jgi:hypothetical protein